LTQNHKSVAFGNFAFSVPSDWRFYLQFYILFFFSIPNDKMTNIYAFFTLVAVVLLSTLTTSSAKDCPFSPSAFDCEERNVSNPDNGKSWIVGNAGGVNNKDGGGLSGAKCSALHPQCALCTYGFKSCDVCADVSAIGGYAWDNILGRCGLAMTFDDIFTGATPDYFKVPNGYRGLNFTNLFGYDPIAYSEFYSLPGVPGYEQGTISPSYIAFNGRGKPAAIFSPVGQEISLIAMWVTPAFQNDLNLLIERFDASDAKVAPDFTAILASPLTPMQITFDGTYAAKIVISTSGGTNTGLGTNVAIDNIFFFVRPTAN
jgi:hypothetical protein